MISKFNTARRRVMKPLSPMQQKGFTIIEVMVAFIMLVLWVYLNYKHIWKTKRITP